MSDERTTFETTRARLEDIVGQVRRKDLSLEQSLDLLEEAVRLVNQCNESIDQTSFKSPTPVPVADEAAAVAEVTEVAEVDIAAGVGDEPGEDSAAEAVLAAEEDDDERE